MSTLMSTSALARIGRQTLFGDSLPLLRGEAATCIGVQMCPRLIWLHSWQRFFAMPCSIVARDCWKRL